MRQLIIEQGHYQISHTKTLALPYLTLLQQTHWAFVGANGSGKSSLAKALSNELQQLSGHHTTTFRNIAHLSLEYQQQIITEEQQRNNSDLLNVNEKELGRTCRDIILEDYPLTEITTQYCLQLTQLFGIEHLLNRRFKHLSTGEARKTLLCKVLASSPDLLILDEPFDGLDIQSRQQLTELLSTLATQQAITLVLIVNRFDQIPDFVTHIGLLAECQLVRTGTRTEIFSEQLIAQLAHCENQSTSPLPEVDDPSQHAKLPVDQPRVILNNGYVHYDDTPILHHLNWCVEPHQHWQIVGPNGAGKSTLLSLITGDHPQGYSNDLTLFGRPRGSGETIWEIKRHIGYVSSSLHLDYHINISVRYVILSGYFDSIGLYQQPSDRQQLLTEQWLVLLGLSSLADTPFQSLSWGQQRLVLIARALVKHPTLLILDEPLQGLDVLNRQLVKQWIDYLIRQGTTQLIFVSHHAEDAPNCVTHRLSFIPNGKVYCYAIDILT